MTTMSNQPKITFAPQLYIKSGTHDISFYSKAFDAIEERRWANDDGSIHVAEFSIDGAVFHLHEETPGKNFIEPGRNQGTTVTIGLFVNDVDATMKNAIAAGATEFSKAQDYDYGYRQGQVKDPFGHHWLIQKKI